MMMRSLYLTTALSIAWGGLGLAQEAGVSGDYVSGQISVFEAGVICAQDTNETREAPDTVAGTTHVIDEAPPFVSTGRMVPAVLGIGFGVRSSFDNEFGVTGVTMTVTHPPFAGSGATEQSFTTSIGGDTSPGLTFYQFDYGYELALGEWTMTAAVDGIPLYKTTFTVVPPAALPELAGACGYQDLIG